jgi:hypothetical protein
MKSDCSLSMIIAGNASSKVFAGSPQYGKPVYRQTGKLRPAKKYSNAISKGIPDLMIYK